MTDRLARLNNLFELNYPFKSVITQNGDIHTHTNQLWVWFPLFNYPTGHFITPLGC